MAGDGLRIYKAATRKAVPLPEPGAYRVGQVAFAGDGRLLASIAAGTATVRKS